MGAGVKIFFDGGLRPSPAGMETAVVVAGQPFVVRGLGAGTSMTAEWLALIAAARRAADLGLADAVLLGDAAAVIAQANGRVRCPPAHVAHHAAFLAAVPPAARWRVRYVKRSQNLAGVALAAAHPR